MIDVSIVIVCMNNLKNLYPCLESIRRYTTKVTYETLVVAYLFTEENLNKARADFPWVTFIESNVIRGFSENNNLALRQAKGKYCFVLNDDTEMKMPVIDRLVEAIIILPEDAAIVSPKILLDRVSSVLVGKPRFNFMTFLFDNMYISSLYRNRSKYVNKSGLFQTYNISGAAFLIKSSIFRKVGWFDERYFFCPEDIALSTLINSLGYKVYVDSDTEIHHYSGGTWSKTIGATKPASVKGEFYFYTGESVIKKILFIGFLIPVFGGKIVYWYLIGLFRKTGRASTMLKANQHALYALFCSKTPKELFIKYYH